MEDPSFAPRVTVALPTYAQAAFVRRAVGSLLAQTFPDWEAVVVDDASPDDTVELLGAALGDARFRLIRLPANRGVGHALNAALEAARGDLVAYLPTDDVWYPEHLGSLVACLDADPGAVVALAGVRHHYNRYATDPLPDGPELVQVVHRRVPGFRWLERDELVTDHVGWMGLDGLREHGAWAMSGRVTCEVVAHPAQTRQLIREPEGGLNTYRSRFRVAHPLRIRTTVGDPIDEVARHAHQRRRPDTPRAADGLRILLVGELAYNADRVLALEARGHRLFALWMPDPYWYNSVGPVPFGHVTDAASRDPLEAIRETRPDVIYALLNWQAVPFAASVLRANPGVPFVWHYKEGPFISLEKGHWADLVELTDRADGVIHTSDEMRDWFGTVVPGSDDPDRTLVMDGDLPLAEWFDRPFSPRPAWPDGGIHTVVPGRPIGLHPADVGELATRDIHLHFYGDYTHGQWRGWIADARGLAPDHLHLHPTVGIERWVEEFSRYDAGWLHVFASRNGGDLRRADWDDLNIPARIATFAAAGIPVLQRRNPDAIVAAERVVRELGVGIAFSDYDELLSCLRAEQGSGALRAAMRRQRATFTFDAHVDRLMDFVRATIERTARRPSGVRLAAG